MRGFTIFISGILVGLVVQMAFAQIQDNNSGSGILELNHVGIAVPDLGEAVSYYEDTLGFPEA